MPCESTGLPVLPHPVLQHPQDCGSSPYPIPILHLPAVSQRASLPCSKVLLLLTLAGMERMMSGVLAV
jgi:hypothetical protein